MSIEITYWERASDSRERRVMSGQGALVATESFEAGGIQFVRGLDRIAFGHPLLKNPDVRRRFVACESPAGRSGGFGARTALDLTNRLAWSVSTSTLTPHGRSP